MGAILRPPTSQEAPFVNDLSRDAIAKRRWSDFRSIFKTRAKEGTCEKAVKTIGFCRFFISRRFFKQVGLLERESVEKHRKNTQIDPPEHPKSTQDRPKSLFGAFFEPLVSTKSVESGPPSDLESTGSVETACRSACRGDLGRSWLDRGVRRGSQVGPGRARSFRFFQVISAG